MDSPASSSQLIYGQIELLERKQSRAIRELTLGDTTALSRVQAIDTQVVALRAQLPSET